MTLFTCSRHSYRCTSRVAQSIVTPFPALYKPGMTSSPEHKQTKNGVDLRRSSFWDRHLWDRHWRLRIRVMYVVLCWIVYMPAWGVFWCSFPSLLRISENRHRNYLFCDHINILPLHPKHYSLWLPYDDKWLCKYVKRTWIHSHVYALRLAYYIQLCVCHIWWN